MYLLDTNHCSKLIDGDPNIKLKLIQLYTTPIVTCVIVRGELIYGVQKSKFRQENRKRCETFFRDIDIYPIDEEAADIYGILKAAIYKHFSSKKEQERKKIKLEKLGISENDLWIAAVAKRHGLIVVSTDDDFERIKEVEPKLRVESWV